MQLKRSNKEQFTAYLLQIIIIRTAEENTDTEREFKRPAFCQEAEGFKGGFRFGAERRTALSEEEKAERLEKVMAVLDEKLAEGKLTQEEYDTAVANLESGDFAFGGKKFPAMKKEGKFQNFGNFKPEKKAFDGKSFGDMKEKFAYLTEEEKAEMKEKFAEKKLSAGKPGMVRKAGKKMTFGGRTSE